MTRTIKLRFDKEVHEVKPNVFFQDHLVYDEGVYTLISIEDILKMWGFSQCYEKMIENFIQKVGKNPDLNVLVYYDSGELTEDKAHQKMLGWDLYNERTEKYVLVGGVCFQGDSMSFHT